MKKIVLFVSVLLLTGSLFAAAPVFEAKPAISGDATVKFGINLDTTPIATGISNSTSTNLTLHLVNKDADEKGGAEGEEVYGWIKLKDFEMNIDGGTAYSSTEGPLKVSKPGIEAKLFLGPVYINIKGDSNATAKTSTTMDIGITNDADTNAVWDVLGLTPTVKAADSALQAEFAGLYLGLKDTAIVDVKLGVQSAYDWDATTNPAATAVASVTSPTFKFVSASYKLATNEKWVDTASASGYSDTLSPTVNSNDTSDSSLWVNGTTVTVYFTANARMYQVASFTSTTAVAAGVATVNTNGLYNIWLSADLNAVPGLIFGLKGNLNVAAAVSYGLGVKAGYGIVLAEGIKLTPEVGFDLNSAKQWRLEAGVGVTLPGSNKDDFTKFGGKYDIKPGLSVMFATGGKTDDASTVKAPMDLEVALFDGTLVPVLDLVAVAEFFGIQDGNAQAAFAAYASADLTQIVPYVGFQMVNANAKAILQAGFDLKVITNTTITLGYKSGDLTTKKADGTAAGLGIITCAVKIAY